MFECCNVTLYKVNENKVKLNKMLLLCVQAQAGGTTLQCAQVCAQHNSCICKLNICSKNTGGHTLHYTAPSQLSTSISAPPR